MKFLCLLSLLVFFTENVYSQDYSFARLRYNKSANAWDKDTILTAYIYGSHSAAPPDSIRFDTHSAFGDHFVVHDFARVSPHTENRFSEYPYTLKQLDLGSYCARNWEMYTVNKGDTILSGRVNIITEDTLVLQRQTFSISGGEAFKTNLDSFAYDEFGMLTRSISVLFQPQRVLGSDLFIERKRDNDGRTVAAVITSWYGNDIEYIDSQFFEYSKSNTLSRATRKEYRNQVLTTITERNFDGWCRFEQETIPYVRSSTFVVGGEKFLKASTFDWTVDNPTFRLRDSTERAYDSEQRLTAETIRYSGGDSIVLLSSYYPNGDPKESSVALNGAYSPFYKYDNGYSGRGIDSSVVSIPFGIYDGYFFNYGAKSHVASDDSQQSEAIIWDRRVGLPLPGAPTWIQIYDITGKPMFECEVADPYLQLRELPSGHYFLRLGDGPIQRLILH